VVIDTVGELAGLYALAELVFVGGSLVPVGGHNLLEPLRAGRTMLCGPHLENQRSQSELLAGTGALCIVRDAAELEARLSALWKDADRHAPARAAREALPAARGAAAEILSWIGGVAREREVPRAPLA